MTQSGCYCSRVQSVSGAADAAKEVKATADLKAASSEDKALKAEWRYVSGLLLYFITLSPSCGYIRRKLAIVQAVEKEQIRKDSAARHAAWLAKVFALITSRTVHHTFSCI